MVQATIHLNGQRKPRKHCGAMLWDFFSGRRIFISLLRRGLALTCLYGIYNMMVLLQRQKSSFNVCHLSKSVCILVLMISRITPSSTCTVFYDLASHRLLRSCITPSST
jgi:hypothetical protein